ncbi:beta-galactosidase [Fusarium solani]|uniref:Beta-galactosidase n=1 Tax=Fusarium solani TaxID=169388 RepID=A0A9P9L7P3_FUSSL|nr:beta-galactosidase [Fusarium solani]KAH7275420.1 beta-galactosidase [Fusarium solani]
MTVKLCVSEDGPSRKWLQVNGKPFLVRGAELQNSSLSSAEYMEHVWPAMVEANINTLLGSAGWEQIEPEEGKFDFEQLDISIQAARRHGLHLILLWFGAYKNGASTYAPSWVKTDPTRFPPALVKNASGSVDITHTLSPLSPELVSADAKVFTKLMQHLKQVDQEHSTVIMVQVENEPGLLGGSRDHSSLANKAFTSPVPKDLVDYLREGWGVLENTLRTELRGFKDRHISSQDSWGSVFGPNTIADELFMAYHFAKYVETVAAAGKAAYPLPLYTNAWLSAGDEADLQLPTPVTGGDVPGEYPSGGAVVKVLGLWQRFSPTLDFISPDIYVSDYASICRKYRRNNQALFIPEQRRDEDGARRIWHALGSHQAIGTAPFGIDTLDPKENAFKKHYGLLKEVEALLLASYSRPNSSVGFFFDDLPPDGTDPSPSIHASIADWNLKIGRTGVHGKPGPGYGVVIHLCRSRFLLVGEGFQVIFSSPDPAKPFTGILHFWGMKVSNKERGELQALRWLNGDETAGGKCLVMPSENPDYAGSFIPVTIPAGTMIAECEPYSYGGIVNVFESAIQS